MLPAFFANSVANTMRSAGGLRSHIRSQSTTQPPRRAAARNRTTSETCATVTLLSKIASRSSTQSSSAASRWTTPAGALSTVLKHQRITTSKYLAADSVPNSASARNDTPGTGALAIGFSLYQHNEYLKGALLRDKSALLDKDLLVKAFRHMGDRAPTTVDGIAELSVWDLKKALHVCAIDTALMEDITFVIISGLLMKLRGA